MTIFNRYRIGGLRAKILLGLGAPVSTLLAGVIVSLGMSLYHQLYEAGLSRIRAEVLAAASRIDTWNLETVTVPRVMATAQEQGLFGNRPASVAFARAILASYPQFTGAYFGYEPNADGQDAAFLAKAAGEESKALDARGRFIPYWFRDMADESEIRLAPLINMESSFYYRGLKNRVLGVPEVEGVSLAKDISTHFNPANSVLGLRGKTMITEPYVYEGKLIIEQTYPILMQGRFVGVAGVDRSLDEINSFITGLKPYRSAEFILVSHRGRIIAATMDAGLKALPIEKTPYSAVLLDFYGGGLAAKTAVRTKSDEAGAMLYAVAGVPTGEWTLVMRVDRDEILEPVWMALQRVLLIAVTGLAVTLLIIAWLAGTVTRPVSLAARAAGRVAEGDLTVSVQGAGDDETGLLLAALQRMTRNLGDLISQVKKSSLKVIASANSIAAAAKSQESVAGELGSSTTEIAAATTEITITAKELAKTMGEISVSVAETAGLAKSSHTSLGGMENAMRRLAEGSLSIVSSLANIRKKADNITQVVTTITQVADQTNLLSLNASIEAVKAGEYGRGFAVVAEEIRRLADQTAVATLDIEQMVIEMQGTVTTGVTEMEQFSEQVRQGVEGVDLVGAQLGGIIDRVQELLPRFEEVNQGMRSQSAGTEQINSAMFNLKEVASSTTSAIGELNLAVSGLREAVGSMRKEIASFRVAEPH